jgi:hypothetical protein
MSGTTLLTIQRGFEVRLDTLARNINPRRPIAWENINFTIPPNGRWWQTSFQAGMPVGIGLGQSGTKHYFGIFQINVYQSSSGGVGGPALATDDANLILNTFPIGGSFIQSGLNIHVISGGRGTGDLDPSKNYYLIPVRIQWQTWVDEEG